MHLCIFLVIAEQRSDFILTPFILHIQALCGKYWNIGCLWNIIVSRTCFAPLFYIIFNLCHLFNSEYRKILSMCALIYCGFTSHSRLTKLQLPSSNSCLNVWWSKHSVTCLVTQFLISVSFLFWTASIISSYWKIITAPSSLILLSSNFCTSATCVWCGVVL